MENKIAQFIFNKVGVDKSEKYLDLSSFRHKLVSDNIANGSTPGYESKDIKFQEEFLKKTSESNHIAGYTTHSNHIPTGYHTEKAPNVNREKIGPDDINSVNIDEEIPKLAMNELRYTIGATLLQRKFEGLRKVIQSK